MIEHPPRDIEVMLGVAAILLGVIAFASLVMMLVLDGV